MVKESEEKRMKEKRADKRNRKRDFIYNNSIRKKWERRQGNEELGNLFERKHTKNTGFINFEKTGKKQKRKGLFRKSLRTLSVSSTKTARRVWWVLPA
jgi:hypothetical protein